MARNSRTVVRASSTSATCSLRGSLVKLPSGAKLLARMAWATADAASIEMPGQRRR